MNRLASIFLAWLCLFSAAFAGGPDAWLVVSRAWSCQQSAIATPDGHMLAVRSVSRTTRVLLIPARNHHNTPRSSLPLDSESPALETAFSNLASCVLQSSVFSPTGWDIRYAYDSEGRRCKKTVVHKTTTNGKATTTEENIYFVWDGWNLIYERHENAFDMRLWDREYIWGEDLSGGTTGADGCGGAGALLLIRDYEKVTDEILKISLVLLV